MIKSIKKALIYSRISSLILTGVLVPAHSINAQVTANFNVPINQAQVQQQVVVAVIDEGVNFSHPDLAGKNWVNVNETAGNGIDDDHNGFIDDTSGYNFVKNNANMQTLGGHGTEVAGIIAKVYPSAKIMSLIVCSKDTGCSENAIVRAIYYATDNGANVINLSLGTQNFSSAYNQAIAYAYGKNVAIVAASGSPLPGLQPKNLSQHPISPICNDNGHNMVLGVGSVDENGRFLGLDNYGACVDLLALGENVPTALDADYSGGELYGQVSGTSFATAQVSGAAAALKAGHYSRTNGQIYSALIATSANKAKYKKYFNAGSLDLAAAMDFTVNIAAKPQTVALKRNNLVSLAKARVTLNIRGPAVDARLK